MENGKGVVSSTVGFNTEVVMELTILYKNMCIQGFVSQELYTNISSKYLYCSVIISEYPDRNWQ